MDCRRLCLEEVDILYRMFQGAGHFKQELQLESNYKIKFLSTIIITQNMDFSKSCTFQCELMLKTRTQLQTYNKLEENHTSTLDK